MKGKTMRLVLAGMAISAVTASAHHSFGATYDMKTEVRMEGKVIQVLLRNPHSFLLLEAPDAGGTVQRWSLEWKGSRALAKAGITADTLKKGDALVVTLNPSRRPSDPRGVLSALHRDSDGLTWDAHPKKHPKS